MKKFALFTALILCIIGLAYPVSDGCYLIAGDGDGKGSTEEFIYNREQGDFTSVPCLFYDEPAFLNAVSTAVIYEKHENSPVGGIVPHHLLASKMIASFWKTVSQFSYDLIVIIGPDHMKRGLAEITTISTGFSAIHGEVTADKGMADLLINADIIAEDEFIMESEHSISSHMPFIGYYMPDTPVLPLLIHGSCSTEKIGKLSDLIMEYVNDMNVLYVASIDFSHYLPLEEANKMDIITERAILDFDYESIMKMTNDNLDSRPSMLFLLHTMSKQAARSISKWSHSNSDIISKTETGYTTSYFTFGFFRQSPDNAVK